MCHVSAIASQNCFCTVNVFEFIEFSISTICSQNGANKGRQSKHVLASRRPQMSWRDLIFQLQPFHFCVSDLHYLKYLRKLVKHGGFPSFCRMFWCSTFCCWQGQPANMNGTEDKDGTSFPSQKIQRGKWKRRIRNLQNMFPIPVTRRIPKIWYSLNCASFDCEWRAKVTIKSESRESLLYAKKYTSLKNVHHRRCSRCWLISAKSNNQKWKWRKSAIPETLWQPLGPSPDPS